MQLKLVVMINDYLVTKKNKNEFIDPKYLILLYRNLKTKINL